MMAGQSIRTSGSASPLGDGTGRYAWHVGAPDYKSQWALRRITVSGPIGATVASTVSVYLGSPSTPAGLVDGGGPYISASSDYAVPLVVVSGQDLWIVWDSNGALFTGAVEYDEQPVGATV